MKRLLALLFALLLSGDALSQSSPGLVTGQVPTAAQWNSFFAAKQDFVPTSPTTAVRQYQTCDVKGQGAAANGASDDTAFINQCITSLQATGLGGIVYFAPGIYCTFTGVNISGGAQIVIRGAGRGSSYLNACGHDVHTLQMTGGNHEVHDMEIIGPNFIGTTHDALVIGTGCVNCKVNRVYAILGRHGITVSGADGMISDVEVAFSYGSSNLYAVNGNFFGFRAKVDQGFFTSQTPGTVYSAWTNGHVYAANSVVTLGGFYIQTIGGGTSGGSPPTLQPYGVNIVDNTVTWLLVAPTTFYGVNLDSGTSVITMDNYDMSGAYTHSLYLSNSLATFGPQNIQVIKSFTSAIGDTITQDAGFNNTISHTQLGQCITTGCAGISINAGSTTTLQTNYFGNLVGLKLTGGTETMVLGNTFEGATTAAVNVSAGVSGFLIVGNNLGGSALLGSNTLGVNVAAGASDHYIIANNDCRLATTCVTDAGTGVHKYVDAATWPTFTPTITCNTGTVTSYTTQNGRYRLMGTTAFVNVVIKINNAGTCAAPISIAGLPFTTGVSAAQTLAGADNTSNAALSTNAPANGTTIALFTSTGGNPTVTDQFTVTGVLETSTAVP